MLIRQQNGNIVAGSISVNAEAKVLVLNFYADHKGEEIIETTLAPLYDSSGSLLANSRAIMAKLLSGSIYIPAGEVKNDLTKAIVYFEDEIAANPNSKAVFLLDYIAVKLKATGLDDRDKMMQYLDAYTTAEKKTDIYRLRKVKDLYTKLNDPEKAAAMDDVIKTAAEKEAIRPDAYNVLYEKISLEKDPAKAFKLLEDYIETYRKETGNQHFSIIFTVC